MVPFGALLENGTARRSFVYGAPIRRLRGMPIDPGDELEEIRLKKNVAGAMVALSIAAPAWTTHAAVVSVDCAKKGASIGSALARLDRSVANTVNVAGTCIENVTVAGHRDLTIAAVGTVSVSPLNTALDTVAINGSSRVTLQGLSIVGGTTGVSCNDRSVCVLRSTNLAGGTQAGLSLQKQSSADVQGSSITGSAGTGIGVFGASSVNVGPDAAGVPSTIANHINTQFGSAYGIFAQDGSFVRVDGAAITGNDSGVGGDRGTVLKLLGTQIDGNGGNGVFVRASTAQVTGSVSNNGGDGIRVDRLGYLVFSGATQVVGNAALSVSCADVTSVTNPKPLTGRAFLTLEPGRETDCP